MFIHIDMEIEFEESSSEHIDCDYCDLIKTLDGVKVDVIF